MSIEAVDNLLRKGRPDCGALEKFADGCNFMARTFWLGRPVVEFVKVENKGEGEGAGKDNYEIKTSGNQNLTQSWFEVAGVFFTTNMGFASFIPALIGLIITIAYPICIIPAALTMCVGLAAKKIALVTDKNAEKYQKIEELYKKIIEKKDLESVKKGYESKNEHLKKSLTQINQMLQQGNEAKSKLENEIDSSKDNSITESLIREYSLKIHEGQNIKKQIQLAKNLNQIKLNETTHKLNTLTDPNVELMKFFKELYPNGELKIE